MKTARLVAIDPGLTSSGWALFERMSGNPLGVGRIQSLPPTLALSLRLHDIQNKVNDLYERLDLKEFDILVCEAPTTMKDPSAATKIEQVRGIFETLARQRNVIVPGRINPRSVHFEVLGLRGKQLPRATIKDMAVTATTHIYGPRLKALGFDISRTSLARYQDIVDAVLIGGLAVERVKTAERAGIQLEDFLDERYRSKRTYGMRGRS